MNNIIKCLGHLVKKKWNNGILMDILKKMKFSIGNLKNLKIFKMKVIGFNQKILKLLSTEKN